MALTQQNLQSLSERLDEAAFTATPIPMITLQQPVSLQDAYAIQEKGMAWRIKRGERIVGMKMGLTSKAKMNQMGVHQPIYGHLTDAMLVPNGGTMLRSRYCHPRVEPEIAFILKSDLHGPTLPAKALLAVAGITSALEIIDSRYTDFKFTLSDVVADNASSSGFVLGNAVFDPNDRDLGNLGIVLEVNGRVVHAASSAAVYDHPLHSLAELANLMALRNQHLKAGQVILSGGATPAVEVAPGERIRVEIDGLGSAEIRVEH